MYNLNKFNKKDNNINLVFLKFPPKIYHKLKRNELSKLTETVRDFFRLLAEFAKVNNLTKEMTVIKMDDEVQELHSGTCGNFQLYFYKHLLDPDEKSKIKYDEKLTKKAIEVLLNKIFATNKQTKKAIEVLLN